MKQYIYFTVIVMISLISNSLVAIDYKNCAHDHIGWGPHSGALFPYEDNDKKSKFICKEHALKYDGFYVAPCCKCGKYVNKSFAHKNISNGEEESFACFSCAQQHEGFKRMCDGCDNEIASKYLFQKELLRKNSGKSPSVKRLFYLCSDCIHSH